MGILDEDGCLENMKMGLCGYWEGLTGIETVGIWGMGTGDEMVNMGICG